MTKDSQTHSKGGRPSSYDEKFPDQLLEYFKSFTDEPFTKEVVSKTTKYYDDKHGGGIKEEHVDFKIIPKRLPTLFGFSQKIGFCYSTVYKWANERVGEPPEDKAIDKRPFRYLEFFTAYKQAKQFQTEYLTTVGMSGLAPSSFAIFTAKNVIGWRDKTEMGFTDPQGKAVAGGFVLLPKRLTPEEAQKEYEAQESPDDPGE